MAAAVGSTIGALRVVIGADTSGFDRGMGEARSGLVNLRRAALPVIATIAAVGAAATAAGVSMYRMARAEMEVIDSQAQLARAIGGTVNGLRAFKLAAEDMGIDGVEASLNRMNRRLGAAEFGAGAAAVSVKALGLDLRALASMDIQERMASIADTIQASGMSAQQASRHLQNLGFEQRGVSELFMQGGDAIRASTEALDAYGLSVSQMDVARIEQANEAFEKIDRVTAGLKTQLAIALAPTLAEVATRLANVARMAMAATTGIDGLRDASDDLEANQVIVVFARKSGVAIAKVVDSIVLLRNALSAFEGYAKWWGATTVRSIMRPFESIVRLGAKMNADMFSDQVEFFDNLKKNQEAGWEQGKKGWDDFFAHIGSGMGAAERGFREAWGQEIPGSPDRPGRDIPDGFNLPGAGGDGASGSAAAQENDQLQQRLENLREFLATREELEVQAGIDRVNLIKESLEAGLISEQEHNQMLYDVAGKFYDSMSKLREEKYQEQRDKLKELNELDIISDAEYHAQKLELLAQQEQEKTDALIEAYLQRKEMLDELVAESDISDEEHKELLEELEKAHQDELTRIIARGAQARKKLDEDESKQRQAVMSGMMGNLTQLMNSGNKEMFRIGKIAAIAQALLAGREAVVSSYKVGARIGGPPLGAAFAATAAAATAAQIASVKSTSFGGGGVSSSGGGSGGGSYSRPTDNISDAPVAAEPQRENTSVTINLQGESYSRQQVRDLIEQINEATADGATLRLA